MQNMASHVHHSSNKKSNNPSQQKGIMNQTCDDGRSDASDDGLVIRKVVVFKNKDKRKKEYWKSSVRIDKMYLCIFVSIFSIFSGHCARGFVIAPPWANPEVNICSKKSWQLIHWPLDGKCYQIFEQGPCPRSQELGFNEITGAAECRCPKNLLYWPATDRCYEEHSRGPCEINQYLVSEITSEAIEKNNLKNRYASENNSRTLVGEKNLINKKVRCKNTKICANGWIFWPSMQECFQLYTQGPCHKGDLLIMNALTAEPYCGCDPLLLRQYYFPPLRLCYEHHTRGPCESGLLFAYNHTADLTHCLCAESLANFHLDTQQCFQFGSKGPCRKGQIFQLDSKTGYGECRCRENYVSWHSNGECYKTYTPGPCRPDQFIVPSSRNSLQSRGQGLCVRNPCPRAHLFFPGGGLQTSPSKRSYNGLVRRSGGFLQEQSAVDEEGDSRCYKVGSRGPCPLGQLVVFERYSGKSFKGECGCSEGYNQNYWPETGECFEWYSQGPCPESFLFVYNRKEGKTECICDEQDGFVFWNETGRCYRVYSQGPCPSNAWLIPSDDLSEVFCECRNDYFFSSEEYACILKSTIVKQLQTKILPFLKNHGKQIVNHSSSHGKANEKYGSAIAENIRKNAWTNLPELLRQIALANAQKQQRNRKGAKLGYMHPVNSNRRDFVPSILASDEAFDNVPKPGSPEQITSPMVHPRRNFGYRSQAQGSVLEKSAADRGNHYGDKTKTVNDDVKHLLQHNSQLKNGGINWTRGIFVKPGSQLVSDDQNRYGRISNRNPLSTDNSKIKSSSRGRASPNRQKFDKSGTSDLPQSPSITFDDIYQNRTGSRNHKITTVPRYRPRRKSTFSLNSHEGKDIYDGTEEGMQLGTTAPGNRRHFPKRQNNPLYKEIVSERRIDEDFTEKSEHELPREGKQTSFERQIKDSIATLSTDGFTSPLVIGHANQYNDHINLSTDLINRKGNRAYKLHQEWWQTFQQQRTEDTSRTSQQRGGRSLHSEISTARDN